MEFGRDPSLRQNADSCRANRALLLGSGSIEVNSIEEQMCTTSLELEWLSRVYRIPRTRSTVCWAWWYGARWSSFLSSRVRGGAVSLKLLHFPPSLFKNDGIAVPT